MIIEVSSIGEYKTLDVEIDNTSITSGLHDTNEALDVGRQLLRAAYDLLFYCGYIASDDLEALDKLDDIINEVQP
jgi:hypothetical protein